MNLSIEWSIFMLMKPKELIKLLKKNGFIEKSQNGSHLKLFNPNTKVTLLVPVHAREMKIGLQQKLLKQAGIH